MTRYGPEGQCRHGMYNGCNVCHKPQPEPIRSHEEPHPYKTHEPQAELPGEKRPSSEELMGNPFCCGAPTVYVCTDEGGANWFRCQTCKAEVEEAPK